MSFKQQFTEDQVLGAIKAHSDIVTAHTLKVYIGCSIQTINNLLTSLINKDLVKRSNQGSEDSPVWLYSRTAKEIQDK